MTYLVLRSIDRYSPSLTPFLQSFELEFHLIYSEIGLFCQRNATKFFFTSDFLLLIIALSNRLSFSTDSISFFLNGHLLFILYSGGEFYLIIYFAAFNRLL